MALMPDLDCMEPESYKKFFRALCWSGTRRSDKKAQRKGGKSKQKKKPVNPVAACYAPSLLGNPSNFAVYATVRRSILARWRHLQSVHYDPFDDSDNDEVANLSVQSKMPKITSIGLRTVFTLVSRSRQTDHLLCEHSLLALLDVLQGHAPEELSQEPSEVIANINSILIEIACGDSSGLSEIPSSLTATACSCLMALAVARGEAEIILNAVSSLMMSPATLQEQNVKVPQNLTRLQRSVQACILGPPSRNLWFNYGVPNQCLVNSFPVDLPPQLTTGAGELVVRSLVSDGCYLYIFSSKGLLKIGSGYSGSIKQYVYQYKHDFFASDRHGWLGYCKNKLYARIGRKKFEIFEIDKETLEVHHVIRLDPGHPAPIEPKSAVFSDGNQLGLIMLTKPDTLTIKMYDMETATQRSEGTSYLTVTSNKEMSVHLLRRRTLAIGRASFDDGLPRRSTDLDVPVAVQFDDNDDDPLTGLYAGQDFGLLTTASGKVFYSGKGSSLGYKSASPHPGKWTLMKETLFNRNDTPNVKKCKVVQVAVGHEGVHAIMVLDNGTALFTGVARRGEDGDSSKHRRTPKPIRPRKILKAEGHYIIYAACNYGSTALVTRQGLLLMFGKDTQHCDTTGLVAGLRHERVIQVALGKAHAVVLTSPGLVYTFGINNKGQCGREFGYTKEKPFTSHHQPAKEELPICPSTHTWTMDYCRVCVLCRECTGFASCQCAALPNRVPAERCGCGEGDAGCSVCGICRRCADAFNAANADPDATGNDDDDADISTRSDKENLRYPNYEGHTALSELDRDSSFKTSCLPPARVAVPGGHRCLAIACGLHHTVLLSDNGDVLAFGSNQYGQIGAGDIVPHHRIVRVRVPRATAIACGSNHTAVLTREGELYTFGSYQKGALGRPRMEEPARTDRSPIWYATPGRVARIGPRHACKAVWVTASGDETFVQVSQSLIKTDTLFSSTVTANSNSIVILPNRPEHTFKCITINKSDGTCNAWSGSEQVDFVNTLACLDPSYDVLWCYQPQMRVMKCYNILTFDSHILQRCCNTTEADPDAEFEYPHYGTMKRLEDFKNLENVDLTKVEEPKATDNVALSNMSILNQELAIPCSTGSSVTRMHGALHLLGCLDSLTYAHETKRGQVECKRDHSTSTSAPTKEDYLTVNRFESHGGGWGYSGQSMEAIRFMCDADILLGGLGLFGGRGEYTAKIKLFDIGPEGGDQENDGELIAESDEGIYECAPRDRYSVMFDSPVTLIAHRWYIAWACINGPSSDCGSSGQETVINDEIGFHFKTSKKSNNGTDVNAGQIPCLLYNVITPDHYDPSKNSDYGEVVVVLSKNISRKVTVPCFKYLITLLQHNWNIFKSTMLETNGQIPITYQKLQVMKHQKRLVYVIRACLRLVKVYVNEIYPPNHRKRQSYEYMAYFEAIGDVRNLIQTIMADATPTCTMLPRKPGKNKTHRVCYVQFALELASSILKEAHDTITSCYHAFYPTPTLKWRHLCKMLAIVKDGVVPASQSRELTSTCAALCVSKSLRDVLQYIVPVTQCNILSKENQKVDTRVQKDIPLKSATLPRYAHSSKPPPVPPRAHNKEQTKKPETEISDPGYIDWYLLDVLPKLLDIVLIPVKQQMMTRQCGQTHDHGEIKQQEQLAEFCCKLLTRIVAELSYSTVNTREDPASNMVQHLITPSRFMRVNQTRSWNTGNGSPDAICFYVDRPGVMLVGVCVYGGLGTYEYSLDLQTDVRMRSGNEEGNPAHCWVNVETVQGVFTAADCQHDVVQLKFDKPVPLKEDFRYAIRLCNHGGRTANGDCGLPSVRGPDGTTFRFASCSLSFNGTTLARGQIPNFIYYSTTKSLTNAPENTDNLISALRDITLRFASTVMERAADLFCTLRNELTAEDLRRNASVLQHSPAINVLIPFTLANLEGLADPKSIIKLLEMIHKLLPHVAAMNLLVPSAEETTTTTTQYYTCVESDHPYKQATVSNQRVLFPASVSWIVLEMDPRSMTAQPEDTLTVYASAGAPKHTCHCSNHRRANDQPFRRRVIELSSETSDVEDSTDEMNADAQCTHYNCSYVSVSAKLANVPAEWPQKALLIPGNEVVFSLETASDYLDEYYKNNDEDSRFGFRCLCVGYEDTPFTSSKQGLVPLEMELVHAGAACASRLLAPHLDITPLSFSTIVEVQLATTGPSSASEEDVRDTCETILLSRGLELSSPPSVHHVLEGQPLLRSVSTERQFLADFVSGAESTAGGRLARWLSPSSRVEPAKCHLKAPSAPVRPNVKINIPLLIRDQYGENVSCPALQVEVVVQRVDCKRQSIASLLDSPYVNLPNVAYAPSIRDNMCFTAITMMKVYQNLSFEELRFASGGWSGSWPSASATSTGRVPAERLPVRNQPDGTFVATWTPPAPGMYQFRCTLDDVPALHEMTVEVVESTAEGPLDRPTQSGSQAASQPCKMRRFVGRFSAGLRVRASPSLQAEELGIVPAGSNVYYVEEVVNIDGTWVRLGAESLRAFTDGGATVAWCIQHHRHHDCTLLVLAESSTPLPETTGGAWTGCGDSQGDMQSWNQEEDNGPETSSIYGRRMPVSSNNLESDSDSSSSPYVFGAEPTKRSRLNRRDNSANSSPIGRHYPRSNGNSGDDDWPHSNYNLKDACGDASETDIEPDAEHRSSSRLTPTATQTSPDSLGEEMLACAPLYSPANKALKHTSPSLPTRTAPAPPPPRTLALSPSQGECLRAIFAALLWHEGIVHDAIACAAFLKFHPNLPKQGTQVVTRASHGQAPVNQRHSVEVSNAGQYLHIHPSTLETLTRSGAEASASRARKTDINQPIKEEDSASISEPSPATVNVLPPALRALVAVWDALYDADQLSAATEKNMPDSNERNENEEVRPYGGCIRKKRDWKTTTKQVPRSVFCELCGRKGALPPIAAHMRFAHSGCNILANKGYDRAGVHRNLAHSPESNNYGRYTCGQIFKESYQVWYVYCDPCRDKQLKIVESMKPPKPADYGYETAEIFPDIDHHTMKENAMFLLDLAPLTNSEPMSSSPFEEVSRGSPVTPVGSLWQPAPAFQSLAALGAAPKGGMLADPARFHSLGRPMPAALPTQTVSPEPSTSQWPRMPRSVSMGQVRASARQSEPSKPSSMFTQDSQTDEDKLTGAGLSLLAQPSATLQKLVGCGAWDGNNPCTVSAFESPRVNPETIIGSPVLQFVLARRDLHAARQKMDAVVRINTVRQYAFEALTWLLRSATQPTCVHDVMWWFCVALDKFARIVPPPLALDDPKENAANESSRLVVPTASASSICPGGEAARGARAAFHAFLGSVSALSPSLPGASAAGLQAVRCWALHYSPHDRNFLHRSQVFSVISKILSHSEDNAYEENILGTVHESFHSYLNKENYVWRCADVTSWCDVTVSSRQGMAGSLTDGSTETFWESGDEDRNKAKWIQVAYPGGTPEDRPHIVCVHLDNTRDTMLKTVSAAFLYGAGGSTDLTHMQDVDIDPRSAAWLCYTLPRVPPTALRVRCELRGPEAAVRVRQIRVLSAPVPDPAAAASVAHILHSICEQDTLRVFRLLTSQVFGKLLEWERSGSDVNGEGTSAGDDQPANDSDLREHVVGILFAGNKLTSLQRQVMSHIVMAIGCEATRVRDDWETALLCAGADPELNDDLQPRVHTQDNYCFEMLSLLLALSGSSIGRAQLAQRTELLADLLTLLHTGSERVQRQVISLIRRMIMEVPPQKMLAAINYGIDISERVNLLDHLACYLAKAITLQTKVKGGGGSLPSNLMMGSSVTPAPVWYMRGETTKKHAHLVAKLLTDMAEGKISPEWALETCTALANMTSQTAQISEEDRKPARCVALPAIWMTLAALTICEQSHLDAVHRSGSGRELRGQGQESGDDSRPFCTNHDDGTTLAVIECRDCGPLCSECDRFLHLNKSARAHYRKICKEEERAIRIDIHEGCGRAKLFWLLLLIDRRTLKALAEFRSIDTGLGDATPENAPAGQPGVAGVCRFCGARGNTGLLAIGNICSDLQCQEHGRETCNRVLGCGHPCGGVRGESTCLPCLVGCGTGSDEAAAAPLRQDADDMCMICFTDPLQAAPAIQLKCGHVFHLHCCKKVLANKWIGPRITFSFAQCPICKEDMHHWTLDELLTPIRQLHEEVRRKALMRLEYEGVAVPGSDSGASRRALDPAVYAMERYAYYVCHKCDKAYFGGLARCEAETSGWWEPEELVCGACSDVAGARICPKHGSDFLEYKCRYCCSVAVFFCFGTSHFCNACHDDFQRVTNIPKHLLPDCPAAPKGHQMPGTSEECPLHVQHPPTGEEFALGCGVCRHVQSF